ncbi:Uncharacterised protein [Alistipes sp. cv1]|nr:Uncharacterised protein [Faecalibacterium prausnitzii]
MPEAMRKHAMLRLSGYVFGGCALALHLLLGYLLLGPVATLVVAGAQLLLVGWFVYTKIRAPD